MQNLHRNSSRLKPEGSSVPEVGVGLLVRPRGRLDAPVAGLPEPAAVASGAVDLLVVPAQMQRVRVQLALAVEALGAPVAVVAAPVAHLRVVAD